MSVRWGIVGASDIAATRVIPKMRERGDKVIAVQSGTREWGDNFARTAGIETVVADISAMLERTDIDAVYISSANTKHRSQAIAAAQAGKHVLCEKPLALSLADATEMIREAEDHDVVLAVNHHLPGAATHRMLRRLVKDGAIGRTLGVRISHAVLLPERLRGWRVTNADGGGVVMDITSHDASVLDALLKEHPTTASGLAIRQATWSDGSNAEEPVPDAVMATLGYESGVLAQLHDAFTIPHSPTRLEILGDEGTLTGIDVMTQDPIGSVWLNTGGGQREIDVGKRTDLYTVVLDSFVAAIDGTGDPSVTAAAGVRALAVAMAVQASLTKGEAVTLPEMWEPSAAATSKRPLDSA